MAAFTACSDQFTGSLFKSQYPHQRYLEQLGNAGLEHSTLYHQWKRAAVRGLTHPTPITVPHQESGYLAAVQPHAIGYTFDARQGEQLEANIAVRSSVPTQVFVDLFEIPEDTSANPKHLISADTGNTVLSWEVRRDGQYLLRIQAELLAELSFNLRLTAEPSLTNPVEPAAKQHIGSIFGDARDGGRRRHEGIDIFASRLTPVVAAADGMVSRVGDNRLGGKVVWLRPTSGRITLYYAHLDSQLVAPGQLVNTGDTLGLMGNTGNARTTPPHLHFGIYGPQGAVDPLPFVRPGKSNPPKIVADTTRVSDTLRVASQIGTNVSGHSPAIVEAAYRNGYRIVLPDSRKHFVAVKQLMALAGIRPIRLGQPRILYARPDTSSAHIAELPSGETGAVVAEFADFLLIEGPIRGWILKNTNKRGG
ncbi:M23 family metallopeptidase [Parapedobacter sp. 10938]|uniref:M23 family metallopeptidase n=1 Tax=Parapedobacter flavus TaxID=3110225 RepID=UPI002DC006EF|nr:M23 family metallopeptidase [Parapedobacter sp. 10938]MEC3881677.1 M23 family metallopeptidase [Parapedobacter sp. 10938]